MRQQIVHNNTAVDVSSFGQGMYTVWVQAEQQDLGMQKLVIKQ